MPEIQSGREHDKERKGSGLAWLLRRGRAPGSAAVGRGAGLAVRIPLLASGGQVSICAAGLAGAGKALLFGAVVVAGVAMLKAGRPAGDGAFAKFKSPGSLEVPSSARKSPPDPTAGSLYYLRQASQGEGLYQDGPAAAGTAGQGALGPAEAAGGAQDVGQDPEAADIDGSAGRGGRPGDLRDAANFGALSSGNQAWGSVSSAMASAFSARASLPQNGGIKVGDFGSRAMNRFPAMRRPKSTRGVTTRSVGSFRRGGAGIAGPNALKRLKKMSSTAHGQLAYASNQARGAKGSYGDEAASNGMTNAFEQSRSIGGSGLGAGGAGLGNGVAPVLGGGAPPGVGTTTGGSVCPPGWDFDAEKGCAAPDVDGHNVTDYQEKLDESRSLMQKALLLAIGGLALIAIGIAIGWPWGAVLIGIGSGMLAFALMNAIESRNIASQIGSEYGQLDQAGIASDSAGEAALGRERRRDPHACGFKPHMNSRELAAYGRCMGH